MREAPQRDRLIVFDLDDTLTPEEAFVRSGFDAADRAVRKIYGRPGFAPRALSWWRIGERTRIFELALKDLGVTAEAPTLEFLERLYLSHQPVVELYPDAQDLLVDLHQKAVVAILTDGPAALMQRKINALDLEHTVHRVVTTDTWGREFWKPHHRGYSELQKWAGLPPHRCLYVGDNPAKDFHGAKHVGWQCLRVRREEALYSGVETPEDLGRIPECPDFRKFDDVLACWDSVAGLRIGDL